MQLPSVRPSVCPFVPSLAAARRCGGFAAVGPAARRYRSIVAAAAPQHGAQQPECGQCHVVS